MGAPTENIIESVDYRLAFWIAYIDAEMPFDKPRLERLVRDLRYARTAARENSKDIEQLRDDKSEAMAALGREVVGRRILAKLDQKDAETAWHPPTSSNTITDKVLIELYNAGYASGHHDTAEGCYTDILPVDSDTYHSDVVAEFIKELMDES